MNEEQQKAYYDYQKSSMEHFKYKKKKSKKIKIIILALIIIYLGLVIFVRIIGDNLYLPIPYKIDRYYDINLNNSPFVVNVNSNEMIPIIPYVLYRDKRVKFSSIPPENELNQTIISENYLLSVEAYSCLDCNHKVEGLKRRKVNISIKNMKIYKYKYYDENINYIKIMNPLHYNNIDIEKRHKLINEDLYDVTYNGKFKEDITNYINDDSLYGIQLYLKNITLRFGLIKKDGKVILI